MNALKDTLKVYFAAHGTKTQNLIINLDHDDDASPWFMTNDKTLSDYKLENEAEISFFVKSQYDAFKAHPETKW